MEPYSDEHRIFLQAILSRGIMNADEARAQFEMACKRLNVKIPVEEKNKREKFKRFLEAINAELKSLRLEIKVTFDEDVPIKTGFFVLCNICDSSREITQLTFKAMVEFSPNEVEYFKILVDHILLSDQKEISFATALNAVTNIKRVKGSRKFTQKHAETSLKKLYENKWIRYGDENIRLSTRFIAEMEPYLQDLKMKSYGQKRGSLKKNSSQNLPDIKRCQKCKKLVIRSINCSVCTRSFHLYCVFDIRKNESEAKICKKCLENQ